MHENLLKYAKIERVLKVSADKYKKIKFGVEIGSLCEVIVDERQLELVSEFIYTRFVSNQSSREGWNILGKFLVGSDRCKY